MLRQSTESHFGAARAANAAAERVADEAMIELAGVSKVIVSGGHSTPVLDSIDLRVNSGEFIAVMGPSGSGKTTLLNLIGGLDGPTGGTIDVAGQKINDLGGGRLAAWRSRHIGFVFQLYNLLPVLTAERNVELPLLLTKLSKAERRKRVGIALKVVGLTDRARQVLGWTRWLRTESGAYWTGATYPAQEIFPEGEQTTWTAAAVLIANDAVQGASATSHLFRSLGDELDAGRTRHDVPARPYDELRTAAE